MRIINYFRSRFISPFKFLVYNLKEYKNLKKLLEATEKSDILSDKTIVIDTLRILKKNLDAQAFLGVVLALNVTEIESETLGLDPETLNNIIRI